YPELEDGAAWLGRRSAASESLRWQQFLLDVVRYVPESETVGYVFPGSHKDAGIAEDPGERYARLQAQYALYPRRLIALYPDELANWTLGHYLVIRAASESNLPERYGLTQEMCVYNYSLDRTAV